MMLPHIRFPQFHRALNLNAVEERKSLLKPGLRSRIIIIMMVSITLMQKRVRIR